MTGVIPAAGYGPGLENIVSDEYILEPQFGQMLKVTPPHESITCAMW